SCEDSSIVFSDLSTVQGATIVAWAWEFGDGATSSAQSPPAHTYAAPGFYTVRLTVTDSNGNMAQSQQQLASSGDPDCCPVLQPFQEFTIREGQFLRIQLYAYDFEGKPITFGYGNTLPGASLDGESIRWQTTPGQAGDYDAVATASDGLCTVEQPVVVHIVPPGAVFQQVDTDQDGIADSADVCPSVPDVGQADRDHDGIGDACDATPDAWTPIQPQHLRRFTPGPDMDHDGFADATDVCPNVPDASQADMDGDRVGDACDPDIDGDGIPQSGPAGSFLDDCPMVPNGDQADADKDGVGDRCNPATPADATARDAPAADAQPVAASRQGWGYLALGALATGVVALLYGRRRNGP
ncbi:MAG: thrombospondin type 3 repeat-containing protein, partial [Thermoplasmatota archaeon]